MPSTRQFRSTLDARWQACLGIPVAHTGESCDLTWVISDFNPHGGGYVNIFRMIHHLEKLGCSNQQVLIIGRHHHRKRAEAADFARREIFPTKARVHLASDPVPSFRALIATSWKTAYFVHEQPAELKKFYFVQDFEPLFFPAGSTATLAENTYRFGLKTITAGPWLSEKLIREYQAVAVPFGFSHDRHIYRAPSAGRKAKFDHDILFYARPATSRRMFELGVDAIAHAIDAADRPQRVAFFGGHLPPIEVPFSFTNLGVLGPEQLARLYPHTRCSLVLSATNASLLPYESMACGCPVVTNQGPHNEWLFPDGYGGVAPTTPAALGYRLADIITRAALRRQLSADGLRLVAKTDWIASARIVRQFLQDQGARVGQERPGTYPVAPAAVSPARNFTG